MDLLSLVGLAACPADADSKIKDLSFIHVMTKKGGDGCVREFINMIIA